MIIGPLKIFKEKPGQFSNEDEWQCLISEDPCWVCIDQVQGYLYIHQNLFGLAYQVIFEWRNDKHLVG